MDQRVRVAAINGAYDDLALLSSDDAALLLGQNEVGNTCLHVASICGHREFCTSIARLNPSLLSIWNHDDETPLVTAIKNSHGPQLASELLRIYLENGITGDPLVRRDNHGCNALHHAIRRGFMALARDLIRSSRARDLLHAANGSGESPIFMAVLKGKFEDMYEEMFNLVNRTDDAPAYSGVNGSNALHAAVKYGDKDFVEKLVSINPDIVRNLANKDNEDRNHDTPMQLAAYFNRIEILEIMLTIDRSLGYHVSSIGAPLLFSAASRGHVDFARKLLEYCPDAPYVRNDTTVDPNAPNDNGRTCLHEAVLHNQMKFVEFILEKDSKLCKLVNMQDIHGDTALHLAVKNCNTNMVSALLRHPHIDISVINRRNWAAIWKLNLDPKVDTTTVKTINWSKITHLILKADERAKTDIENLRVEMNNKVDKASRKDVKSLTTTYAGNTSLVAILIATVTFAAAFTLPGGYSSAAGSEGLAILVKKPSFQAFLIFDTLAMCSSIAVAFLCIKLRSMDYDFLVYYRYFTKKLMWFAYIATTLAFATGVYTVVAPRVHWLAILICALSVVLPILTVFIGEWPILQLKARPGFDPKFIDMA